MSRAIKAGASAFFLLVCLSAVPTGPLSAEAGIEIGLSYGIGARNDNRFTRGIENFRSSISPLVINQTSLSSGLSRADSGEFWFRGEFADNHWVGLSFGQFVLPSVAMTEFRSDGLLTKARWSFTVPYFLVNYRYAAPLDFLRLRRYGWWWEWGASFGFVPSARWRLSGATLSTAQYANYDIDQQGRTGNMARLDLGLRRWIGDVVFLSFAAGLSYAHIGYWEGEVNNSSGAFYYLRNGSLIPLTSSNILLASSVVAEPTLGTSQAGLIRERADMVVSSLELRLSTGFRF